MSDVSVVIPSLNAPLLDAVVAAVEAQEGLEHVRQVLVVGRDEARLLRERRLPGGGHVRLLDTRVPVSEPVARNLGLAEVDDGLVIFLDSDCLPRPGWLRGHLAAQARLAQQEREGLVCGGVLASGASYWALVYNLALFWGYLDTSPAGERPALPTLNLSFRRALARRVGAFDETLPRATDVDWTLRARAAALALHFDPRALVEHRHARHTLHAVWRDCAGSGQHARAVRLRHPALLAAPTLLGHARLLRALAPLVATWATARVALRQPGTFRGRWSTLPGFWLTKLAWAWGQRVS